MANQYQAIVIGAGMSGSWVAKELCDAGVKTLMLDRGPNVEHLANYPTASKQPWDFEYRGAIAADDKEANPIVSRCYNYYEGSKHFFVKDAEHPYKQEKPFDWIKGYQVGGKSLLWARQVQRWGKYDFEAPSRDGYGLAWPIGYNDLKDYYDKVEHFIGVSGNMDGLDAVPDGIFLKPLGLTIVEQHLKASMSKNYDDRHLINARCAHLTEVKEIHRQQGRGQCQNRLICERGCPFGGYYSANSSTIPWAKRTGNLDLVADSVVHSIIYDEQKGKATGVRVIDANTKEETVYEAPYIFVNASTVNTNLILLNSKSSRFPNGLGNDNGLLGKYFAFHNYRAKVHANCPDFADRVHDGRSPGGGYIPRYRNLYKHDQKFHGGYSMSFWSGRGYDVDTGGFGEGLVKEFAKEKNFGPWFLGAGMMGETIPKKSNFVALDSTDTDPYGMPLLNFNVGYDNNDELMIEDFFTETEEMFDQAGFVNIRREDTGQAPGLDIHEMGGVRMGTDPKTSLLDSANRMHKCSNVIVSDGACMTSTSTQNPSLTYMALAARATDIAIKQMKDDGLI